MRFLDELRAEHELIDGALGSLRTWVEHGGDPADGQRFLFFLRRFASDFHHDREHDVLFEALRREAELPVDRGPVAVLKADHLRLGTLLDQLAPLLLEGARGQPTRALATEYSRTLWQHLDAENSVLFPESEERLRRSNVSELSSRPPSAEEHAAMLEGRALVTRYPQFIDEGVMRGEGCIMCPAYGISCRGLEREWWTQAEWEELPDRSGGD